MQKLCNYLQNSQLGIKIKNAKKCQKRFHNEIKDLMCKETLKNKPPIFEKIHKFRNQPLCNGHVASLGQKLKLLQKTSKKYFDSYITLLLCKKPLQKTPNI